MRLENGIWLVVATCLLLLAHLIRAYRWSLLFPRMEDQPDRRGLTRSLCLGYAVNAIVPLRIGEIVRAAAATKLRGARFAEVLATVVAERIADVGVVTAFVVGIWLSSPTGALPSMALVSAAMLLLFASAAVTLRHSPALRRSLWFVAGIFNPRVRVAVADFAWSTAEILAGGTMVRWQFTATTFVMWSAYLAAYGCFAAAVGTSMLAVMDPLLLQPLSSILFTSQGTAASPELRLFVLAPIAAIILAQQLWRLWPARDRRTPRLRYRGPRPHHAASTRYSQSGGYSGFLDALFSDARSAVSGFGMRAVGDCIVHRYLHGGSEALTALVETEDRMLIRKFGMGTAALKLQQQAEWLQRHAHSRLPLVPVLNAQSSPGTYCYDMPGWERTSEFYETIHSNPLADSSRTFLRVLHSMDMLHGGSDLAVASEGQVEGYLAHKVSANAAQLERLARQAFGRDAYSINGVDYHLNEWAALQDVGWLKRQLCDRRCGAVHGDFTIENIVAAPDREEGFYIIDPNPENIFDSPLIDWAKMMQSLHLGYEGLNRSSPITLNDAQITVPIARSEAYAGLHRLLEGEIVARFTQDGLREVYFHELVNYLRLTPYKARQSTERGLAFLACTSMLLRKYRETYG